MIGIQIQNGIDRLRLFEPANLEYVKLQAENIFKFYCFVIYFTFSVSTDLNDGASLKVNKAGK